MWSEGTKNIGTFTSMLNSLSALASDIQTLLSLANHGAEK